MDRRQFLSGATSLAGLGLAGCTTPLGSGGDSGGRDVPSVADGRAERVYVPTHRDGMAMKGMAAAGDYRVGVMYTYPHRFWIVTGTDAERVAVREEDDVHLMVTVWDEASGTVLPVGAGVSIEVERDGELVAEKSPWPMISQPMGFHYGDNVALDGDGTYAVTVSLGGMTVDRFGAFAGRFEEGADATVEMEYSAAERNELPVRQFPDRRGERGAVSMMDMDAMPHSVAPAPADLPGRQVGEGESGDARFVVTAVEAAPVAGDGAYLLVSPRTRYNDVPLPMMSLSATLERDGDVVHDGRLSAGVHPDAGYHYGASTEALGAGEDLTISVDSPPQVSRHEGYETAFLEMPDVELTLE